MRDNEQMAVLFGKDERLVNRQIGRISKFVIAGRMGREQACYYYHWEYKTNAEIVELISISISPMYNANEEIVEGKKSWCVMGMESFMSYFKWEKELLFELCFREREIIILFISL